MSWENKTAAKPSVYRPSRDQFLAVAVETFFLRLDSEFAKGYVIIQIYSQNFNILKFLITLNALSNMYVK